MARYRIHNLLRRCQL